MSHGYVIAKISHLKRVGLVAASKDGIGRNGGACPDWLVQEQKDEQKRLDKARVRQVARNRGDGFGGRCPDIEWFVPARDAA